MKRSYYIFIFDLIIVAFSYLICIWIKPGSGHYLRSYLEEFFLFLILWGLSSFFFKKYSSIFIRGNLDVFRNIILSNIFSFAIITSIMYMSRIAFYSRAIVVGTIGIASIIELIFGALYYSLIKTRISAESNTLQNGKSINILNDTLQKIKSRHRGSSPVLKNRENALLVEISQEAFNFIFSYARIESPDTLIISTNSRFNIDMQLTPHFESIVNIERMNDIRYINKFFESANSKLPKGGLFISYVETQDLRKKRIMGKFPPILNYIFYTFDFIIKRVFPKFLLTKKAYFFLTRGQNRVITKAEIFGRLYSCGFEIIAEKFINNYLYFIARKIKNPMYPENPSYGPFIKLERIGKGGKLIRVYKMRTMHPYAEYLQEYVYERVGLDHGGKFKNDFRISTIGKIMRMFWIDELPMLINVLKGELKIVGVRPLSHHYFNLYNEELQKKRIKYKPGLVPPFYVDYPKTLDEIMASEIKYLEAFEKHPYITDIRYFFKAMYNIIFKKYRSK